MTSSLLPYKSPWINSSLNSTSSGSNIVLTHGLYSGQTSTPTGEASSDRQRLSGRTLFQIPPGTSSPLPKFPPSLPTISFWPHQTPQNYYLPCPLPVDSLQWSFSTLTASSDTPMNHTNCDLSSSIKKPSAVPSACILAMACFI